MRVAEELVGAIAAQDEAAMAACFADDAELRALTTAGLRERNGAADVASLIARWFGDSTKIDLAHSASEEIGDRLHIAYRFEGVEEGAPYVVEQHLYCTLADGKIERADLLCSGFRPRPG